MKCPRCHGDHTFATLANMFCIKLLGHKPTKPIKRFSLKRETLRQIIRADIEEDKHRKVKEYSF